MGEDPKGCKTQRRHHNQDSGTQWSKGYQTSGLQKWEENGINQIITRSEVAQNKQEIASVMRAQMSKENVMNLNLRSTVKM